MPRRPSSRDPRRYVGLRVGAGLGRREPTEPDVVRACKDDKPGRRIDLDDRVDKRSRVAKQRSTGTGDRPVTTRIRDGIEPDAVAAIVCDDSVFTGRPK